MNTYGIDLRGRRRRRRHSAEFKTAVIQECRKPGVSIAAVALAHGLNANMLRKWVRESERDAPTARPALRHPGTGAPGPGGTALVVHAGRYAERVPGSTRHR